MSFQIMNSDYEFDVLLTSKQISCHIYGHLWISTSKSTHFETCAHMGFDIFFDVLDLDVIFHPGTRFLTFTHFDTHIRIFVALHCVMTLRHFISTFHMSRYVTCHILTRWWRHTDDLWKKVASEVRSVACESKQGVRVVAIGRGHNREGVGVRDGRLGGGGACDDDVEEEELATTTT